MRTPFSFLSTLVLLVAATVHADPPGALEPFLDQHCFDCHDSETSKGDLDLTALGFDLSEPANFSLWVSVLDRVEAGEMPPKKKQRPGAKDQEAFLNSLEGYLRASATEQQDPNGRAELRRLSRVEFANSLKDLLDLPHLEVEEMLPPDGLAHGFRKSAGALDFSHVMVERYLEVADHALWKAIAPRHRPVDSAVIRCKLKGVQGLKDSLQTLHVQVKHGTAIPLNGMEIDTTIELHRGNFAKRQPGYIKDSEPEFDGVVTFLNGRANHNIVMKGFRVHQSGYYKLRVHGWGVVNDHGTLKPSDRGETVAFYSPTGRLLGRCDLPPNVPSTSEIEVWLNEGEPVEYLAISTGTEQWHLSGELEPFAYHHFKANGIALQWFEMEGPLGNQWPPESHRRLLGDLELQAGETELPLPNGMRYAVKIGDEPMAEARQLLRRFAARALRRPMRDGDLEIPLAQTRARLQRGEPFVDALFAGYRAILVSPEFLLLEEKPGMLDAWALASRLAFFLTNSPPDLPLRQAAASGALLEADELRRQADRLLSSRRSARFVAHFLDDWLDLRNITLTEPDENIYPEYNALLAESMVEETRAYFAEMLKSDLGARHLIDSDFATINQRMAELYSIGGVQGSHTRKVSLPANSARGGLLTQGSLLKITANGTTTSPVVRGTFTLDRLLGDPPPPPPSAVPAIEPDITGATTIRDQLARHRADPNCASCHAKIDPPGFALESFDVMGGWRERYRATVGRGEKGVDLKVDGKPARYKLGPGVDATGELEDGSAFKDLEEFRELLAAREEEIARNLLEKLIVYATGEPVGFRDREQVETMLARLGEKRFGLRSMIHELVQSELFRHK